MSAVKIVISNKSDKQAFADWEEFLEAIRQDTPVRVETPQQKADRIKWLEKPGNEEEWFKEYFPKFSFAEPADFHIKSSRVFLNAPRIFQCRAWARGLSKSTRRMMEVFYKMFAQKVRLVCLLISKSEDNAIRLLAPYKGQLEANQRLISDYGLQEGRKWKAEEFVTRKKSLFRAVGKGQNPRGAKNDETRVNLILFDDIDDDEECRNDDRLDETWKWIEKAVMPCVEISRPYWICFDNNIIAENSLAKRAQENATHVEEVAIRENGRSVWPEKNSEEDIDFMLSLMSYESAQGEYFNNPMSQGKTFPDVTWGKCPPINSLPFVVIYSDPATSNKDRPAQRSKASNSTKAIFLLGKKEMTYYIYYGFLDVMSSAKYVDCLYATYEHAKLKRAKQTYSFIENNALQDPFFEQVLLPLIFKVGKQKGGVLPITPDTRKKPDKWFRIEGTLEPLNRLGLLVFNEEEKKNPHMERLAAQFKAAKPTSKLLDGPDCIEGGVKIIETKETIVNQDNYRTFQRPQNKKRF